MRAAKPIAAGVGVFLLIVDVFHVRQRCERLAGHHLARFLGGGEVEYVKLIVDGMPAGDAESGNVDWQRFAANSIERNEVLHGPGSFFSAL